MTSEDLSFGDELLALGARVRENVGPHGDRTLRSVPSPPDGYDPGTDCLLIDRPDGEVCIVPPWRCATSPADHLIEYGETLDTLRGWAENCLHAPLRVWRLRCGTTELERET